MHIQWAALLVFNSVRRYDPVYTYCLKDEMILKSIFFKLLRVQLSDGAREYKHWLLDAKRMQFHNIKFWNPVFLQQSIPGIWIILPVTLNINIQCVGSVLTWIYNIGTAHNTWSKMLWMMLMVTTGFLINVIYFHVSGPIWTYWVTPCWLWRD